MGRILPSESRPDPRHRQAMTAATAATATPQVMRDRLLQAMDGQGNICNMVVVMEVIACLEKYPITKEALEETRLGKLVNDVRKKTKNEDLVKRAKKLLRNWQKLIEPVQGEVLSKGPAATLRSSNGGAHSCISTAVATPNSVKTGAELKSRNDFNNCSPRVGKCSNRKRKADLMTEEQLIPAKISKATLSDKNTNGIGVSTEAIIDTQAHQEISEPSDNERLSKIPVNAVKPHPSAAGYTKPPSTSSLLKASVLQQQARQEQAASRGRHRPRSPRYSLHSPQTSKQEAVVQQSSPKAQSISSPSVRSGTVDPFGLGPSPPSVSLQGLHTDCSQSADTDALGRLSNASSCSDAATLEHEGPASNTGRRKKQKCRPKDCLDLDGQPVDDDDSKPVRLKDRRLTFDPVTGQIRTSFNKDSFHETEVRMANRPDVQWSEQRVPPVLSCPFQQTDWKELSRNEIIQSYLSQQSNVLTSSGAHTPGAHFFMTEFLKKEEHKKCDAKETHALASGSPPTELPGINRDVNTNDLNRLHTEHWRGVNGCYDTKGTWYDWTECISLALHGDEGRLNILPYVCLD